jgi:hypothetical protein
MHSKSNWTALTWNAQCLNTSKQLQVDQLPSHIQLLVITETWFVKPHPAHFTSFPYAIHSYRRNTTEHGGVSIYARHPIKHCTNLTSNTDRCIFAEIQGHGPTGNGKLLVGGIYHHSFDNDMTS